TSSTMRQSILILLLGDLGDAILTLPAIHALRERYPSRRLLLMAKQSTGAYIRDLCLVDEVIEVDKHALDRIGVLANARAVLRIAKLVRRLRHEDIQSLFVFQHLSTRWGALKFGLLAGVSGAGERFGLDNGRGWFLTHAVRDRGFGAVHEAAYWLEVAGLAGAAADSAPRAHVHGHDRQDADRLLRAVGTGDRAILAVHPGVGWYGPGRQWGAERFAQAARLILDACDMDCLVVGTEADREPADALAVALGQRARSIVGETNVLQLAAVLERCSLVLSNDSGVAHLAAAVGAPTLTVFGPSNDAAWRPLGGQIAAASIPCRPCFYRDFEIGLRQGCATRECLALVTPQAVARQGLALLEGRRVAV
ncbi:MAG TPA: glycosyltransferase family 9 protein, partial [Chloroflexota bacterium]